MKHLFLFIFFSIPWIAFNQEVITVEVVDGSNPLIQNLNSSAYFLADKEKNHLAVDLVDVYTTDSTFTRLYHLCKP